MSIPNGLQRMAMMVVLMRTSLQEQSGEAVQSASAKSILDCFALACNDDHNALGS